MKVLVDASTLIALANIGELDLLKKYNEQISITGKIKEEFSRGEGAGYTRLENTIGDWIDVLPAPEEDHYSGLKGLDSGERSILSYAKSVDDDIVLILDEKEARAAAKAEGFDFTGTLALIVYLSENGSISKEKGREIVKKLAKSEFGMTVGLYDWALEKLD